MARAFWKGTISFGLVNIPVSLQPAVQEHELSFTLLDRKDFSPVGNKRYNKNTGRDVPWDEVVRGYEHEEDEYVVLSDEELRRANVEASETIEIVQFVKTEEIDPLFYETPYYVAPIKKASKSYALLREALERSGRVGIARVVLRTRQRLAALLVRDRVLVLDLLRYAHEIKGADEIDAPAKTTKAAGLTEAEIKMAEQLVAGMAGRWEPSRYKDTYHDDVLALVRRKVRSGKTHTILEPEAPSAKESSRSDVMDLMPLLKRSIAARAGEARRGPKAKASQGSRRGRRASG
jgi:DNA end-binding protein Ku